VHGLRRAGKITKDRRAREKTAVEVVRDPRARETTRGLRAGEPAAIEIAKDRTAGERAMGAADRREIVAAAARRAQARSSIPLAWL
jgi:hypothetical protein